MGHGNSCAHTLKRNLRYKDAVKTGYFARNNGGGQYGVSQTVGSSPNACPPARIACCSLSPKEGAVFK